MKKTEIKTIAQPFFRTMVVLLACLTVFTSLSFSAFAVPETVPPVEAAPSVPADNTGATQSDLAISSMNTKIYTVYLLIRNNIAFPLLALSFASCGFKILGAGILGTGQGADKGIQAAKEQIFTSVAGLFLVLLLPYLISYGISLFKSNAWTPPGVILLPSRFAGGTSIW